MSISSIPIQPISAFFSNRPARYFVAALLFGALTLLGGIGLAGPAQAEEEMVIGVYGVDGTATGHDRIAAAGFNTVMEGPYVKLLDEVAADGLNAIVWLGPYDHATCSFDRDDDFIREYVGNVAGHEAIVAYYLDDEPGRARVEGCPNVAQQVKDRSDLVKSVDPSATTFIALAAGDGQEAYPWQYFTDSADILGLVVYPCNHQGGCGYDHIRKAIAEAETDGVNRYWAVIQAFGDNWYRQPSLTEMEEQINIWAEESSMEGYLLYKWDYISGYSNEELAGLGARFDDVPRGSAFFHSVEWLAESGVTKGCNPPLNDRFCPNEYVSRGQMAAFLTRALGLAASPVDPGFSDDDGSIFEDSIGRLAAAGVTKGCNPPVNDRFCPDAFVTRGQMAAFLSRALGLGATNVDAGFVDDDESLFEDSIGRLAAAGLTKGCNPPVSNKFCPNSYVTRGQMAAFLARALANG